MSRRMIMALSLLSPAWGATACLTPLPELRFLPAAHEVHLHPTGVAVFVEVRGPDRPVSGGGGSPGCSVTQAYNELTLLQASCGDGCNVEDAGVGEWAGSIRLAVTATTAGFKTLAVMVHDAKLGSRHGAVEMEFAELGTLEVTHDTRTDPGTALPMLVGLEPEWCVSATALDGRELELRESPLELRSLTPTFSAVRGRDVQPRACWNLRAEASGTGHLRLLAAGLEQDFFPIAVAEEEIAEVHLHGVVPSEELRVPLDQEGHRVAREQPHLIAPQDSVLDLIVRLVTTDGRSVRGGANRFWRKETELSWPGERADGQLLEVRPWAHACIGATIGAGSVALPVYIEARPGEVPNPCLAPPASSGGAGGVGLGGVGGVGTHGLGLGGVGAD